MTAPSRHQQPPALDRASAKRYLAALYGDAPEGSLIELRYRAAAGMGRAFYAADRLDLVATAITERALQTDVYVGALPRRRRGGGRDDLVPEACVLWVDCDTPEAVAALDDFSLPASIVVASGTGDNRHTYWLLDTPIPIDTVEDLNRALAHALGADLACTDPARILRPPSYNHKHHPPAAVRLVRCDATARYRLADLAEAVGDVLDQAPRRRTRWDVQRTHGDPLLSIEPRVYVERLAGLRVPRHGKIRCPFHDDGTPSLHVYREPEHGWYCYGCNRGGTVFDFAALLWGRATRGPDFVDLRDQLRAALGLSPEEGPTPI